MRQLLNIKFIGLMGLISLLGLIGLAKLASAQSAPEFIVSWRAASYVPSDYQGKILPSKSTAIEMGFDLIDNGKIADLSRSQITWVTNNKEIKSGLGAKNAVISNNGSEQLIRVSVDYKNSFIEETFSIPSAKPEIIVDTKLSGNSLSLRDYMFSALPYFFNINNLSELLFSWSNNGKTISGEAENPDILKISLASEGLPQKTSLNISASASNLYNPLEMAGKSLNLIIESR